MLAQWLTDQIISAASQLVSSGVAIYKFDDKVKDLLLERPLQEWEATLWFRGVKLGLIKTEQYFFRAGTGKKAAMSLFVRNAQGKNVGLRREAITQAATYVSLITEYGYGRPRIQFETRWMDVAVFDEAKSVYIYAENKAADRILKKLCDRLEKEFAQHVPYVDTDDTEGKRVHDDPLMKANHIWKNKPRFFWGRSPTRSQPYRVLYGANGFELQPVDRLPHAHEVVARSAVPF